MDVAQSDRIDLYGVFALLMTTGWLGRVGPSRPEGFCAARSASKQTCGNASSTTRSSTKPGAVETIWEPPYRLGSWFARWAIPVNRSISGRLSIRRRRRICPSRDRPNLFS